MEKTLEAIKQYEQACTEIVELFCEKHNTSLEFWVADIIGSICCIGDHYLNMEDIILDLKFDAPKNAIWDWYWQTIDAEEKYNYYTYLRWKKHLTTKQ